VARMMSPFLKSQNLGTHLFPDRNHELFSWFCLKNKNLLERF